MHRELCADLRDYYISLVSNRMNETMKVLTIIATIFMPLSFVAALYGMNFNTASSPWNMPELNWRYGYPAALGLMSAIAVGMILFFRRRGWIGSKKSPPPVNGEPLPLPTQ
jgi:magnesium transporter